MALAQSKKILKDLELANQNLIAACLLCQKQRNASIKELQVVKGINEEKAVQLTSNFNKDTASLPRPQLPFEILSFTERLRLNSHRAKAIDKKATNEILQENCYEVELQDIEDNFVIQPLVQLPSLSSRLRVQSELVKKQVELLQQQIAELPQLKLNEQEAMNKYQTLTASLTNLQAELFQIDKDWSEDNRISMAEGILSVLFQEKTHSELKIAILESKKRVSQLETRRVELRQALFQIDYRLSKDTYWL